MTWELWLRLDPLSSNAAHRMNRYKLAEVKKHYRHTAAWVAKSARIPRLEHCVVDLDIYFRTNHRRDEDNYVYPLLKSLCDGIVDSGVVVDGTPAFMTKMMPRIHVAHDPRGLMCLRVSE